MIPDCLILASSGRMLAQASVHAGLRADVLDCFGDQDCRALAARHETLPMRGPADPAPDPEVALAAVHVWAQTHPGQPLLVGAGFEDVPAVLERCAERLPLAGTHGPAIARCKDPWQLAEVCHRAGLAIPELRVPDGSPSEGWLARRAGACGGAHLRPAIPADHLDPQIVWQRRTAGVPVSLLFHVAEDGLHALSVQQQWCAPAPDQPFRFGGVARAGAELAPAATALETAARTLAPAFGLVGLNGLDGLWDGTQLWVLEINPRPTASLGLLPPALQGAAMQAHLATARLRGQGLAPDRAVRLPGQDQGVLLQDALNPAMGVVYASASLSIPADFRFPSGCHDLPALPYCAGPGQPLCSVHVADGGIEKLRALIGTLRERLLPVAGADILSSL